MRVLGCGLLAMGLGLRAGLAAAGAPENRTDCYGDPLPPGPCVDEVHGVDRGQNVDPVRRRPDLEYDVGRLKILHRQAAQGGSKPLQRPPDPLRICVRPPDPDIQVAGRPRKPAGRQRVRADQHELSLFRE